MKSKEYVRAKILFNIYCENRSFVRSSYSKKLDFIKYNETAFRKLVRELEKRDMWDDRDDFIAYHFWRVRDYGDKGVSIPYLNTLYTPKSFQMYFKQKTYWKSMKEKQDKERAEEAAIKKKTREIGRKERSITLEEIRVRFLDNREDDDRRRGVFPTDDYRRSLNCRVSSLFYHPDSTACRKCSKDTRKSCRKDLRRIFPFDVLGLRQGKITLKRFRKEYLIYLGKEK